jgi:hypothetical protein
LGDKIRKRSEAWSASPVATHGDAQRFFGGGHVSGL